LLYKRTKEDKIIIKHSFKKSFLYASLCEMMWIKQDNWKKIDYLLDSVKQLDIIKKVNTLIYDIDQIKQKIKF